MAFEAKFPGKCPSCGEGFSAGQRVRYNADDSLVHEHCDDEPQMLRLVAAPLCPKCFMEMSLSGVCGECDE